MRLSKTMALAAATSAVLGAGFTTQSTRPSSLNKMNAVNNVGGSSVHNRFLGGRIAFCDYTSSVFKAEASSSSMIEPSSTKEPSTNIEFPSIAKFPGTSKHLSLLGTGVREKKIAFIPLKVYAVGFYVDQEKLEENSSLKNNIAQGEFEKGLRIVLASNVEGALFSLALDNELKPRMKPDGQVLAEFGGLFKGRSLKKGTEVYFTWVQPSVLHVEVVLDGTTTLTSSFSSQALAAALFDVYLGDKPVSPSLKESVFDGLNKI